MKKLISSAWVLVQRLCTFLSVHFEIVYPISPINNQNTQILISKIRLYPSKRTALIRKLLLSLKSPLLIQMGRWKSFPLVQQGHRDKDAELCTWSTVITLYYFGLYWMSGWEPEAGHMTTGTPSMSPDQSILFQGSAQLPDNQRQWDRHLHCQSLWQQLGTWKSTESQVHPNFQAKNLAMEEINVM